MAKRGRRPTPDNLHQLHGNRRGRKPKTALDLEPSLPKPPEWLSEKALIAWSEIGPVAVAKRVMTIADRHALVLLCEAWAEWRECLEIIAEEGRTYEAVSDRGGSSLRAHPAVAQAADAWRRCDTMLANFGLSPAARARVRAMPVKPKKSLGEFLKG